MPDPIQVRLATLEDLAFVAQDQYLPNSIIQRKIAEGEVFVAVSHAELVGYLRLEHLWSAIPYIALIRVLPAYQRQGIGTALLEFVATTLRERGDTLLYSSSQADEPKPQAWHPRRALRMRWRSFQSSKAKERDLLPRGTLIL